MAKECLRLSLIIINVIFLIGGLALLGLGIWVQVEKGDYVAIADSDTGLTGAILIIVVGVATVFLAAIGFFGALKRNVVALWIFCSFLLIIFVIEIAAVILGMVWRNKVEDELRSDMLKTKEEYGADAEGINDAWDWAQQKFECCGVDNYTDWRKAQEFNNGGHHYLVPDSCCKEEEVGCGNFRNKTKNFDVDKTKIYTKGCFNELKQFVKDHLLTIGLSALFFLIIQLIVIILTIMLALSISGDSKIV